MTLAAFLTVAMFSLFAAASPGPTLLMSARVGLAEGFRIGAAMATGVGIGSVILASAAIFGLAVVFTFAPWFLTTFKLIGGAYLIYIAFQLWRHASIPTPQSIATATPRTVLSAFRLGLLTQLSNPKPVVLFSAIFIGTIPPETPKLAIAALLCVVFLNETLCNMLVARLFSFERSRRIYLGAKGAIDRCFSGSLALLGAKIALT